MWTFGHKTQDLRQHKTYCVWLYVDVHVSPFERRVVLQDTLHWVFPFWDTWYYHLPLRVFQALSPWHPMLHLSEVWWLYQQISNENGIKYRPSVWSHFYWQRQRERVREKLGALSATVKIKRSGEEWPSSAAAATWLVILQLALLVKQQCVNQQIVL